MPSTQVFTTPVPATGSAFSLSTTTTTTPFPTSTVSPSTTTTVDALLKLCLLWSVLNKPELQRFGDDPDFPEVPTPPLICNDYFLGPYSDASSIVSGKILNGSLFEEPEPEMRSNSTTSTTKQRVYHSRIDHKYSSRSFAVIGALAGIVFILLIMALTTCIRHRRELYIADDPASRERGYAREILINHIRQFRANAADRRAGSASSIDPPPSYEDVVKVTPEYESTSAPPPPLPANDRSSSSSSADRFDDSGSQPPSYLEAIASMSSSSSHNVVIHSVVADVADDAVVSPSTSKEDESNIKRCEGVTTIHIE